MVTWPEHAEVERDPIDIVIPIYDRFTALDAVGPYETLQRLPGATVTFVANEAGEIRTENGFLGVTADASFSDKPNPDVIVVPGGVGSRQAMNDEDLLEWLRSAHETTTFTTSVCTGSIVLGAAGLLNGLTATTHWGAYEALGKTGATPTATRVVEHLDQRIITAAGVSAGIDMALRLSELLVDDVAAKAMQLMIEYDPQPPFDAGAFEKSNDEIITRLLDYSVDKD